MRHRSSGIWLLIITPLAFVVKDVVATMVVSLEIGIGSRFYTIALLPGPVFVESWVTLFNFVFGAIVGLILYLCLRFKKLWLLLVPPSVFFLKDMISLTIAGLSTSPEKIPEGARHYFIAMLPGSAFHRLLDPMLFNVLFGSLLGLIFYIYSKRRKAVALG